MTTRNFHFESRRYSQIVTVVVGVSVCFGVLVSATTNGQAWTGIHWESLYIAYNCIYLCSLTLKLQGNNELYFCQGVKIICIFCVARVVPPKIFSGHIVQKKRNNANAAISEWRFRGIRFFIPRSSDKSTGAIVGAVQQNGIAQSNGQESGLAHSQTSHRNCKERK